MQPVQANTVLSTDEIQSLCKEISKNQARIRKIFEETLSYCPNCELQYSFFREGVRSVDLGKSLTIKLIIHAFNHGHQSLISWYKDIHLINHTTLESVFKKAFKKDEVVVINKLIIDKIFPFQLDEVFLDGIRSPQMLKIFLPYLSKENPLLVDCLMRTLHKYFLRIRCENLEERNENYFDMMKCLREKIGSGIETLLSEEIKKRGPDSRCDDFRFTEREVNRLLAALTPTLLSKSNEAQPA